MTVKEIAQTCAYETVYGCEALEREIKSIYCCDLLSFVMGRAPADSAWVTVMGNVNAAAVATLADVACIVLADGTVPDEAMLSKIHEQGIAVLLSKDPVFVTAKAIDQQIDQQI